MIEKEILIEDYTYTLPENRIALFPLERREMSKLMVVHAQSEHVQHATFSDINRYLPDNATLIVNNTKVIHARLQCTKPTGGEVELLVIAPADGSVPERELSKQGTSTWQCIVGGKRVNTGLTLHVSHPKFSVEASILERDENRATVQFFYPEDVTWSEILQTGGTIPLPPYLHRDAESSDEERYQTTYAQHEGSVAAPTAGLHFTPQILDELHNAGKSMVEFSLHVGLGTFQPVTVQDATQHLMHGEQVVCTQEAIASVIQACKNNSPIVCVGTTSFRTIESLYWLGVKEIAHHGYVSKQSPIVEQWEAYQQTEAAISVVESLEAILTAMQFSNITQLVFKTSFMCVPGYQPKVCNGLITNFHQPNSTLMLLVASFLMTSENNYNTQLWRKVYQEALQNEYRFLSYGDSSLLLRTS